MSDDEYEIPLQDQRVFGAGLKRKRVRFIPSSSTTTPTASNVRSDSKPAISVADRYLDLVLSTGMPTRTSTSTASAPALSEQPPTPEPQPPGLTDPWPSPSPQARICETCNLPLSAALPASTSDGTTAPHEATLAHQLSLPHSHPPSALDRRRLGLRVLRAQGWDPDARMGLGVAGTGIRAPLKLAGAKTEAGDRTGVGLVVPKEYCCRADDAAARQAGGEKLDAGRVRRGVEREKVRERRLRELFYCSEDVQKYLSGG